MTGLLYLFEPITLDEKNGIYLMNWTDVGIAATEKLSARLVFMAKDTCSVQETRRRTHSFVPHSVFWCAPRGMTTLKVYGETDVYEDDSRISNGLKLSHEKWTVENI